MIKRDSKIPRPIWDFWEAQILLDVEKTRSATVLNAVKQIKNLPISVCFYKEYFLFEKFEIFNPLFIWI